MKYQVLIYGAGISQPPTKVRQYETFAQAQRYAKVQSARHVCALVQQTGTQPQRTNAHGSW